MNAHTPSPQDLVRQAVIEVAQLPENELLIVIEMVDSLKKQRNHPNRNSAVEIVARTKARATETSHLSRAELMQEFGEALDSIRAEAVAKGTVKENIQ